METISEANPRKIALTNALIWAIINIVIFVIIFYVFPDLMTSFVWGGIQMLISIGLAIYFCLDLRKKIGGYWTFKQALGSIFLMFFGSAVIVFFFTMIFAKIEPSYVEKMKEASIAAVTGISEKMGMSQDLIDEALAKSEVEMEKQFNPGIVDLLKSICMIAIMYFIGSLIFAAIFKKDPPLVFQTTEE